MIEVLRENLIVILSGLLGFLMGIKTAYRPIYEGEIIYETPKMLERL